jgi:hypothetical protein
MELLSAAIFCLRPETPKPEPLQAAVLGDHYISKDEVAQSPG